VQSALLSPGFGMSLPVGLNGKFAARSKKFIRNGGAKFFRPHEYP
jgi:hypothetical protein